MNPLIDADETGGWIVRQRPCPTPPLSIDRLTAALISRVCGSARISYKLFNPGLDQLSSAILDPVTQDRVLGLLIRSRFENTNRCEQFDHLRRSRSCTDCDFSGASVRTTPSSSASADTAWLRASGFKHMDWIIDLSRRSGVWCGGTTLNH